MSDVCLIVMTSGSHVYPNMELLRRFLPRMVDLYGDFHVVFGGDMFSTLGSATMVAASVVNNKLLAQGDVHEYFCGGATRYARVLDAVANRAARSRRVFMMANFAFIDQKPEPSTIEWLSKREFIGITHDDEAESRRPKELFPASLLPSMRFLTGFQFDIMLANKEVAA